MPTGAMHDDDELVGLGDPPSSAPAARRLRRSTIVRAAALIGAVLLLVAAFVYTDDARRGFHQVGGGMSDGPGEKLGVVHNRVGQRVFTLNWRLEVGRYGRVFALVPTWPRDNRRGECFVPDQAGVRFSIVGPHGFDLSVGIVLVPSTGKWEYAAAWGAAFSDDANAPGRRQFPAGTKVLHMTQVAQPTPSDAGERPGSPGTCPAWHVRLPLRAWARAPIYITSATYGYGKLDSPAYRAYVRRLKAEG